MEQYMIAAIFGTGVLLILLLLWWGYRLIRYPEGRQMRRRLEAIGAREVRSESRGNVLRKTAYSNIGFLDGLLRRMSISAPLARLLGQADARYPLGFFLLLSVLLGVIGWLGGTFLLQPTAVVVGACIILGASPFLYLMVKKERRMKKMIRQFPEGVDSIANALKAGHPFLSGLRMVADKYEAPLGPEFAVAVEEVNFGLSVDEAMANMADRIDLPEVRYFVISVLLQRETGGNLAEILGNLSQLIRDKAEFQGKLKVLSAEGKFSAWILGLLPVVMFGVLNVLNPKYTQLLLTEDMGRVMLGISIGLLLLGAVILKKMATIEV
jgi:tight adherence protein B